MKQSNLIFTDCDYQRLKAYLDWMNNENGVADLKEELTKAHIIPQCQVPPNVVTMNSTVMIKDECCGTNFELMLVYPSHADETQQKISILSPIGIALIGLKAGDSIDWPMANGSQRKLTITSVLYQPESSGNLEL